MTDSRASLARYRSERDVKLLPLYTSDDGEYVQTVYFTSEAEARVGEQQPPPPEVAEQMAAEMADARFFDLHQPRMMSPG